MGPRLAALKAFWLSRHRQSIDQAGDFAEESEGAGQYFFAVLAVERRRARGSRSAQV